MQVKLGLIHKQLKASCTSSWRRASQGRLQDKLEFVWISLHARRVVCLDYIYIYVCVCICMCVCVRVLVFIYIMSWGPEAPRWEPYFDTGLCRSKRPLGTTSLALFLLLLYRSEPNRLRYANFSRTLLTHTWVPWHGHSYDCLLPRSQSEKPRIYV